MSSHQNYRTHSHILLVALFLSFTAGTALGQYRSDNSKKPTSTVQEDQIRRLDSEVLGLSVGVPEGAKAQHLSQGETSRIRIRENSSPTSMGDHHPKYRDAG